MILTFNCSNYVRREQHQEMNNQIHKGLIDIIDNGEISERGDFENELSAI